MKRANVSRSVLLMLSAALAVSFAISGCQYDSHPDLKPAIYKLLDKSDLSSVVVSQDRHSGVLTLSGVVGSGDRKLQAENIARQAAPGYTISNQLQIDSAGIQSMIKSANSEAQTDQEVEKHCLAALREHNELGAQDVQCAASNGTVWLKGKVKSTAEKKRAEQIAKQLPQVQHVVNDLEVRPGKHGAANS